MADTDIGYRELPGRPFTRKQGIHQAQLRRTETCDKPGVHR